MYVCKSFSTMLDTGLRKNNSKKIKREIGKHKLNETVKQYEIEKVKQTR